MVISLQFQDAFESLVRLAQADNGILLRYGCHNTLS